VGQRTICDAIMTPIPNDVTFPINLDLLAGGVTATDEDVRAAMRFAFEHFKIVTEPGAVVGLAAVLNGQIDIKNKTVATFITGGNIDISRFSALIGGLK
jgi:threonine dehydratase